MFEIKQKLISSNAAVKKAVKGNNIVTLYTGLKQGDALSPLLFKFA
jgi:hypothetical protein